MDTAPRRSHVRPPARRVALPGAVTAGLVTLHVFAVTWLVAGGGLYIDDIRAQAYAAGRTWWQVRCCTCNTARSYWEIGAIRWKAASKGKRILFRCPTCQKLRAAAVEKIEATLK